MSAEIQAKRAARKKLMEGADDPLMSGIALQNGHRSFAP